MPRRTPANTPAITRPATAGHRLTLLALSMLALLLSPASQARAANISELFISGGQAGFPDAVELTQVPTGTELELMVVDRTTPTPLVLSKHTLSPAHNTVLLKADTWAEPAWWWQRGGSDRRQREPNLAPAGPRTLMLFDGPTHLNLHAPLGPTQATLLDAVTLNPLWSPAEPAALDDEPVLDVQQGWALIRPRDARTGQLADDWLAGAPVDGHLPTPTKLMPLTPGLENPTVPEPGSAALLLGGAAGLLLGRRGRLSG